MKKIILLSAAVITATNLAFSQGTAINNTGAKADSSAMLDVSSTNKGVLLPRLTQAQKSLISAPANGLLIYQTDGVTGFYYNAGSGTANWLYLGSDNLGNHTASDSLNMINKKIYNLATCTNNFDAANKYYVDNVIAAGGGGGGTLADTTYQYSRTLHLGVSYFGSLYTVPADKVWAIQGATHNSGNGSTPVRITNIDGAAVNYAHVCSYYEGGNVYPIGLPYFIPSGTTITFAVGYNGTHSGKVSINEYKRVVQ